MNLEEDCMFLARSEVVRLQPVPVLQHRRPEGKQVKVEHGQRQGGRKCLHEVKTDYSRIPKDYSIPSMLVFCVCDLCDKSLCISFCSVKNIVMQIEKN